MDNILSELNLSVEAVIYLDVDQDLAMKRALGRITCPNCKRSFNKYDNSRKPKVDNICDDCGVELVGRSDDNEETFKVRFQTYLENVKPLLDYYNNKNILYKIEKKEIPEEIFESIKEVIR